MQSRKLYVESRVRQLGCSMPKYTDNEVKNEPMLWNCDYASAYKKGGPITRKFLDLIPESWRNQPLVVDTRVHMLMPGWFPCIPGWHHDDVPRTRSDGQPNYWDDLRSEHCVGLVNGNLAPTEFAVGSGFVSVPDEGVVNASLHEQVVEMVKTRHYHTYSNERNLLVFDDRCWHRGTEAVGTGWRWFGRVSRYHIKGKPVARPNKRTNEVRKQVQIYMSAENAGW